MFQKIFIVRHAQGYHNLTIEQTKKILNLTKNNQLKYQQLTNNGIIQAIVENF